MASISRRLYLLLLLTQCINLIPSVEGQEEVELPAYAQKAYQLYGFMCFPLGMKLPCECEEDECYMPCCRDMVSGEYYYPSFYKWSPWIPCTLCDDFCDETMECRVKYEEVTQIVRPETDSVERRRRALSWEESMGLPVMENMWLPEQLRCKVQRTECRPRESGVWGDWYEVSVCSSTCHEGLISEERDCEDLDGNPIDYEKCAGGADASHRLVPCNTNLCSEVSEWEDNGACYEDGVECLLDQIRICESTDTGDPSLVTECAEKTIECPTDECAFEDVSAWVYTWGDCDNDCSPGMQTGTGVCVYIADDSPSTDCDPALEEVTRDCNENYCNQYHDYTPEGDCSETCGDGTQTYTRTCVSSTLFVPESCKSQQRACNERECPNYEYTYGEPGPCSSSCEVGTAERLGTCVDTVTGSQSDQCADGPTTTQTVACNEDLCETYSAWQDSGDCSEDCGVGIVTQIRTCDTPGTDPTPTLPEECVTKEGVVCTNGPCLTVGEWSEYSDCSDTCSPGDMTRTRPCLDADTMEVATGCTENLSETIPCNEDLCTEYAAATPGPCLLWPNTCQEASFPLIQSCSGTGTAPEECSTTYTPCAYSGEQDDVDLIIIMDDSSLLDDQPGSCSPGTPHAADDAILTDPNISPNFIQQKKFISDLACAWPFVATASSNFAVFKHPNCESDDLVVTFAEGEDDDTIKTNVNAEGTACLNEPSYFGAFVCIMQKASLSGRVGTRKVVMVVVPTVDVTIQSKIDEVIGIDNNLNFAKNAIGISVPVGQPDDTVFVVVSVSPNDSVHSHIYKFACLSRFADNSCLNYIGSIYDPIEDLVANLQALIA